jgi:hypothetical protein
VHVRREEIAFAVQQKPARSAWMPSIQHHGLVVRRLHLRGHRRVLLVERAQLTRVRLGRVRRRRLALTGQRPHGCCVLGLGERREKRERVGGIEVCASIGHLLAESHHLVAVRGTQSQQLAVQLLTLAPERRGNEGPGKGLRHKCAVVPSGREEDGGCGGENRGQLEDVAGSGEEGSQLDLEETRGSALMRMRSLSCAVAISCKRATKIRNKINPEGHTCCFKQTGVSDMRNGIAGSSPHA